MSSAPPGRQKAPGWLARFVPIVGWLPEYQVSWLSKDAVAGFTIWGLLIPEMIAYASLAGLPPRPVYTPCLRRSPSMPVLGPPGTWW